MICGLWTHLRSLVTMMAVSRMPTASTSYSLGLNLRAFTGPLSVFSIAQKWREVNIPKDNPQPMGTGEGGWMPSLLILWWEYSETCSTCFLRGSPVRLTVSLIQPVLGFFPPLFHFPYPVTLVSEVNFSNKLLAPKSLSSWDLIWEELRDMVLTVHFTGTETLRRLSCFLGLSWSIK